MNLYQDIELGNLEKRVEEISEQFRERSLQLDDTGEYPHENMKDVINKQIHTLPLESMYGGVNAGFEEIGDVLIKLASGCPSSALCLAMHYYTIAGIKSVSSFQLKDETFRDIFVNGQFMTSFNQPNVAMARSDNSYKDSTKITVDKVLNGYIVNGIKHCVSGSSSFKYIPVYGHQTDCIGGKFQITALILEREDKGVTVDETWNYSGMKATQSNNIILCNVFVPSSRLIGREGYGIEDTNHLVYWSRLTISSVYLGIAKTAIDYITKYIKNKKDYYSNKPLAFMPGTQYAFAEIRILYETAYNQFIMYAKQADQENNRGKFTDDLFQKALITKQYVTKTANEIVWKAMQIEGMSSMVKGNLLERLYRDVRASTFHQPSEDLLMEILAKKTLGVINLKSRWV